MMRGVEGQNWGDEEKNGGEMPWIHSLTWLPRGRSSVLTLQHYILIKLLCATFFDYRFAYRDLEGTFIFSVQFFQKGEWL